MREASANPTRRLSRLRFVYLLTVVCVAPTIADAAGHLAKRGAPRPSDTVLRSTGGCTSDLDCPRPNACTNARCHENTCVYEPIQECEACELVPDCPPIDVVFIMDTSNSMKDESEALCGQIDGLVNDLAQLGVTVNATVLGITETPGEEFSCLANDVVTLLGSKMPGNPSTCVFPESFSAHESWGPATTIVADRFTWTETAIRLVIPISDEGPCDGTFPSGCNDPGDDRESIDGAISAATFNDVIVFPITGTGSDNCVLTLASDLAQGTGGQSFASTNPESDLMDAVASFIDDVCPLISPCDDGDICTVQDTCDQSGECSGTPITDIPCGSDSDCHGLTCDSQTGFCTCYGEPDLCLKPTSGVLPSDTCFLEDEAVVVDVELGVGTFAVTGGQFLISYDPGTLDFVDVKTGSAADENSPFGMEIQVNVDEQEGEIFYAVGADFNSRSAFGPAIMARLLFRTKEACSGTTLCFIDDNPQNTILTDNTGTRVPFHPCCEDIRIVEGPPTISCPESMNVLADAGGLAAHVSWDPVVALGGCGEPAQLDCTATHIYDINVDDLLEQGGRFPTGTSRFNCSAINERCGLQSSCTWDIAVDTRSRLQVSDLELAPAVAAGPIERCVEFDFYANCAQDPVHHVETVQFGFPYATPGHTGPVTTSIPAGQYACVTARDPHHTLTSVGDVVIEGVDYVVRFAGDPDLIDGGNWLVSGDLDNSNVIDIFDFAIVMRFLNHDVEPDSTCQEQEFHADINGDGVVDETDMDFVLDNYYAIGAPECCAAGPPPTPVTSVTIHELIDLGLAFLREADLNHDKVIDDRDIDAFLSGEEIPPPTIKSGHPR